MNGMDQRVGGDLGGKVPQVLTSNSAIMSAQKYINSTLSLVQIVCQEIQCKVPEYLYFVLNILGF